MLLGFRSLLSSGLISLHDIGEFVSQRANDEQFLATDCAARGDYIDELEHHCDVVNINIRFLLFSVHVFIVWILKRQGGREGIAILLRV